MNCHIEIYLNHNWHTAAIFEPDLQTLEKGVMGGCRLNYDIDFAVENLGNKNAELIPGLTVGFELYRFKEWPAFLVDLLPAGAGRRAWLKRMQIKTDGPHVEWHLLYKGAGNPPGNLRIAEAVPEPPPDQFIIGFPRQDIIDQQEDFLEYAEERGAYVAGASSVQGEAPKYMLVEDIKGMFHADGAIPDDKIKKYWLVKYPRGKRTDDRNQLVLKNEAHYLEVARTFGINVGEKLTYENGALFVPRFDRRIINGKIDRPGMHSLYAVAEIPGYGAAVNHDIFCEKLARVVTNPGNEIREYILRDILNLALRNTDNHGRNTAIMRAGDQIKLTPLFDFAPMFLDPEGIGRVTRWEDERPGEQPDWNTICDKLHYALDPEQTKRWLQGYAKDVERLPVTMKECNVDDEVTEKLTKRIEAVANSLNEIRP
ncbi:MAG: hypothetical protein C0623_06035 [Desulfuromonas sp.]|nr:MAG: hypothetical protein C0623_06035 [Desulfuromonas sp.]